MPVDTNKIVWEGVHRYNSIHDITPEDRVRTKFTFDPPVPDYTPVMIVFYSYDGVPGSSMTYDATYEDIPDDIIYSIKLPYVIEAIEIGQSLGFVP